MYKREFLNQLNQNKIPNSLLLYGACNFQTDHYTKAILSHWGISFEDLLTLYFDDYDFGLAKNHLSQASLFGDKNALLIRTTKPLDKTQTQTLLKLCKKSANNHLLIACYDDSSKLKTYSKLFAKTQKADHVRFFKSSISEAITYLAQSAKAKKIHVQSYALSHLYKIHNENLELAINELEKLAILNKEISVNDIDSLVYGTGEIGVERFIQKLLFGKPILEDIQILLESGQIDEIRLINALQNYITQLFNFFAYIKLHGSCDTEAILGYRLPPFLAKERAGESMKFNLNQYRDLLIALSKTELTLKTQPHQDKASSLLACLLEISKLIKS